MFSLQGETSKQPIVFPRSRETKLHMNLDTTKMLKNLYVKLNKDHLIASEYRMIMIKVRIPCTQQKQGRKRAKVAAVQMKKKYNIKNQIPNHLTLAPHAQRVKEQCP